MRKYFLVSSFLALGAAALHFSCGVAMPRLRLAVLPKADASFTATRMTTGLCLDGEGNLWATTNGGVLRRNKDGIWKKFARLDGLPSTEARKVSLNSQSQVEVALPRATATWFEKGWIVEEAGAPPSAPQAVDIEWRDSIVQAAPGVFRMRPKGTMDWKNVDLPASRGTHASALLVVDGVLWVALYGDGIWRYDGKKWQRLDIAVPDNAREITAMVFDAPHKTLWLGTRRDGIWRYASSGWQQYFQEDEPLDHNAQYIVMFGGELFISTLDDGLQIRAEDGWRQLGRETLSSDAPRHLIEFQGKLYVRHGGGQVDVYDGKNWTLNVFSNELPRKKTFALATDGDKLYAAQWGGWSEWDGKMWTHFLQEKDLQGLPVMGLQPGGDRLWIGTQSRGVAEFAYQTKKIVWHDERHGLPDDWVTCLLKSRDNIFAGTFVGGLTIYNGKKWYTVKELDGDNVTDLREDGEGGVLIATRRGVWRRDAKGVLTSLQKTNEWLDREAQALCVTKYGTWIGARTGLFWLRREEETVRTP